MKLIDINQTYTEFQYTENEIADVQKILLTITPFIENYQFTYNYRIGLSDGRKYFYKVENGKVLIPKGLAKGLSEEFNISYEEFEDAIKFTKEELQEHVKSLKLPFDPYEYQFNGVLEMLNDKRMVTMMATGCLDESSRANIRFDHYVRNISFKQIKELFQKGKNVSIESPYGYSEITDYFEKKDLEGVEITFNDNSIVKCAITHFILVKENNELKWKNARELKVGDITLDKNVTESKIITNIKKLPKQNWIDFNVKNKDECYIQNDIIHHNSGKSLVFYIFLTFLLKHNYRAILLVPNVGLVEQMFNDFKDYGMTEEIEKQIAKIYSGQEKNIEKPLIISTYQSMIKLIKYPFIKDIDCIAVDEAHGLNDIENSMGKIVSATENAKWKIGLTGTLPETEVGRLSLYSFLGSLRVRIRPIDLIKMGRATPVNVKMIYFNYDKNETKPLINKMEAKRPYSREIQFLESYLPRNENIIKIANTVTQKYGNSILLFSSIAHGEFLLKIAMKEKISELKDIDYEDIQFVTKLSDRTKRYGKIILYQSTVKNYKPKENEYNVNNYDIYFIKGEVKGEDRHKISKILEDKKHCLLIANYATTSTGTSIKNIHNIIFGITTKGFIRVSQSLGRGMRLHKSKDHVNIIDIVDDITGKNYALQHSEKRLTNVYHFNGYPIEEKEIKI